MQYFNPQIYTALESNKLRLVLKMKLISTTDEYHKLMLPFFSDVYVKMIKLIRENFGITYF